MPLPAFPGLHSVASLVAIALVTVHTVSAAPAFRSTPLDGAFVIPHFAFVLLHVVSALLPGVIVLLHVVFVSLHVISVVLLAAFITQSTNCDI